jgi:hypothetical protein
MWNGGTGLANGVGDITETGKSTTALLDVLEINEVTKASARPQLPSALHGGAAIGRWKQLGGISYTERRTFTHHG